MQYIKTFGQFINENINDLGDCYKAAAKLMQNIADSSGDYKLVHGMVNGQGAVEGYRFGHAWVEHKGKVLDHANGNKFEIPKNIYYKIGGVVKKDNKYYTLDEMLIWVLKEKHWGPWEISGETIKLNEDVPDEHNEIGIPNLKLSKKELDKIKKMQ